MIQDTINLKESKAKGRVVQNKWLIHRIFDLLIYLIIIGIFPFISSHFLVNQLDKGNNLFSAILFFLISIFIGGFLLYTILTFDRLKRIGGLDKDKNREIVKKMAERLNWNMVIDNKHMTIASLPWNYLSSNWGRQIIIIYDRQDLLVNSISYGLFHIRSPFHWFGDRKLENIILEEIKNKIKENDTPTTYKNNA